MRNEEIYKLLEKQEDVFNAKMTGVKAEIKAGTDMTVYKLNELIDYQKIQNGRTTKLEDETRVFRFIHRNPKAAGIVIGLAVIGFIALFIIKNLIL